MKSNKRGQSLTDVLLAAVFLATGGLVIYASNMRAAQGEAWKAERIFAQAELRNLVEVFSIYSYTELQKATDIVKVISINDNEDVEAEKSFNDPRLQEIFEKDSSNLPALKYQSFFTMKKDPTSDGDVPIVKTKAEMLTDEVYKTYLSKKDAIELKRAIIFKDDSTKRAIVVCAVRFKASTGQTVVLKMPFTIFNNP